MQDALKVETVAVADKLHLPELPEEPSEAALSWSLKDSPLQCQAAPASLQLPMLDIPKRAAPQPSFCAIPDQPLTAEALAERLNLQPCQLGSTLSLGNSAAFIDDHLSPKPVCIPDHSLAEEQQPLAVYDAAIAGIAALSWPPKHAQAPMLEMPLNAPHLGSKAAAAAVIKDMLAACPTAKQPALSLPIATSSSSKDFLAQDLLLKDSCRMLPPVLLDPVQSFSSVSVHQMLAELKSRPARSLMHLEVYLDWTLSDSSCAGAMQHRVMAAKKWIVDQLSPSAKQVWANYNFVFKRD